MYPVQSDSAFPRLSRQRKMADISDGAIVGSAIIKLLEKHGKEAPDYIGEYVRSMKNAIR